MLQITGGMPAGDNLRRAIVFPNLLNQGVIRFPGTTFRKEDIMRTFQTSLRLTKCPARQEAPSAKRSHAVDKNDV